MENHLELQDGEWEGGGLFTKPTRSLAPGRAGPGMGLIPYF